MPLGPKDANANTSHIISCPLGSRERSRSELLAANGKVSCPPRLCRSQSSMAFAGGFSALGWSMAVFPMDVCRHVLHPKDSKRSVFFPPTESRLNQFMEFLKIWEDWSYTFFQDTLAQDLFLHVQLGATAVPNLVEQANLFAPSLLQAI